MLDGYGGGRTVPYITHWDSYGLRTLSVPRKYVFVASFKPDDDLIIFRGANAECAKTIPAMLFLPVPPWTVRKKKLNGNKLFPVRLSACGTASWPFRFFFLFLPFFFASGSAPEEVGSDMSRPSIEAVVRFKGTRVEYTDL